MNTNKLTPLEATPKDFGVTGLNSVSFRLAYRNVAVVGLVVLVLTSILSSLTNAFSLGCGLIIGLSPFITWHLISRLFIAKTRAPLEASVISKINEADGDKPSNIEPLTGQVSQFLKTGLVGLGLLKLALIGIILYLLFSLEWVTVIPFIIGMVLVHSIIIGTILAAKGEPRQRRGVKSV